MVEQLQVGKLKEVGQVRTFTRATLRYFGEDPKFITAAVEFADAAFYIDRSVQFPGRLQESASRKASRLGLSAEDIGRAQQLGIDMFVTCKYLVNGAKATELTPEVSAIIERRADFLRRRAQQNRDANRVAKRNRVKRDVRLESKPVEEKVLIQMNS